METVQTKMFNFLKYRKLCLLVSGLLLATGIAFYFINSGFRYNIDFLGGTEVRISCTQATDIAKIRTAVEKHWEDNTVQNLAGDKDFIIRMSDSTGDVEQRLISAIQAETESVPVIVSKEHVGPEAGQEVRWNTFMSVLMCLLALLLYISLRHKYSYAIGAIVALAHDLLVLLTFYVVFQEPVSLNILAGILAVLGYSLNDTVVVYSRIRENQVIHHGKDPLEIVELSINQTLKRTLLTSFTTFISMMALFFYGGEILRGFSMTMMIAIVVGTYSSIYIASPIMLYFNKEQDA